VTVPGGQAGSPTMLADRLQVAVCEGAAAALDALLDRNASFVALGKTLSGAAAVRGELLLDTTRETWRALRWQPAQAVDGMLRLHGDRAPGTRDRGLVLTLRADGEHIVRIEQQRTPPPPPPAAPLVLPDDLRRAIDHALIEKHPMLLAYADERGQPVLSYRGSTQVDGDDRLAMWVRNRDGAFIRAIAVNPRVALMYRNEETRATYQLQGRARVSDDPADRRRVFDRAAEAERAHDFAMLGAAVLIDLDRVEGYAGVGPQGQVGQIHLQRGA
jgi:hypothetical protein